MKGLVSAYLSPELRAIPMAIFAWEWRGDDFVLVDFNSAAEQLTANRIASFIGRTASSMYESQPNVITDLRRALESSEPIRSEMLYRLVTTGERRELNVTYIRRRPDVVIVMAQDVTSVREAKTALRDSEARYRTLVQGAPDGIVVHRGGTILFVNEAFADMMNAPSPEALVGRRVLDLVHPEDRAGVKRRVASIDAGHKAPILEERLIRSDGTVVYAEIAGIPTTYDGKPAVQAIARNVSERRRAEALFYAVSQQSLTGISVVQDGRFVYVNPRCAELLGYSVAEMIGMQAESMVAPKSRELVAHMQGQRLERASGKVQFTFTAIRKDGSEAELEVYGSVVDLDGKPALVGTLLDATERERIGEQLRQAQKMDAIGRLAGGVAHDFNNILTAIGVYSELLLQQLDDDSPLRRDVLEIRSAGQRATDLTRQLLAFSRRQALQPQMLDVNDVITSMTHMLRRLIDERIGFSLELGEDPPPVLVDRGQLEQVVMNLCVNARDAMPDGGHLQLATGTSFFDDATASVHAGLQPGHYTHVRVSDDGAGMTPAVAARIFEPFFTTKPAGQGTGLGLAVVYGIVKQSGGYIMLDTEPGAGATFTVLLPSIQS